ncbi:hypothetical protein XPA_008172 [Xanthoria parietina]
MAPDSPLYNNPDDSTRKIMSYINPEIPVDIEAGSSRTSGPPPFPIDAEAGSFPTPAPSPLGLSSGAKIGIAIGIPIFIIALLVLGSHFWRRRKAARRSQAAATRENESRTEMPADEKADADRGGNDLIPCENVTSNPLDFCCDGNSLCCDGGGGRFRLDSVGEPFRTLSSAAISVTRQPKSSTSSSTKVASIPTTTSTSATSIPAVPTNPASTSVSSPPPLTPDPPSASPELSTGAKAAIGIGAAFGSTILLAAILWLWWRRKRSSRTRTVQTLPPDNGQLNNSTPDVMHQQQQPATAQNGSYYGSGLYELSGEHHRELSGKPHYEMPTGNHHPAWEMPERVRSRSLR